MQGSDYLEKDAARDGEIGERDEVGGREQVLSFG